MTHVLLFNRSCTRLSAHQPSTATAWSFSKSLGQIQNLDPDHLMSALKSKTTPGDTLPARPYSYRRLDPKDGCRCVQTSRQAAAINRMPDADQKPRGNP